MERQFNVYVMYNSHTEVYGFPIFVKTKKEFLANLTKFIEETQGKAYDGFQNEDVYLIGTYHIEEGKVKTLEKHKFIVNVGMLASQIRKQQDAEAQKVLDAANAQEKGK